MITRLQRLWLRTPWGRKRVQRAYDLAIRTTQALSYCNRWQQELIVGSASGDELCTSINEAHLRGDKEALVRLVREHAVRAGRLSDNTEKGSATV